MGSQNKQNETKGEKKWCDAPPCGQCRKQQRRVTIEGGKMGKRCQTDCEREKRERRVRLLHTVQHAGQKYHLFVCKCLKVILLFLRLLIKH